MTTDKTMWMVRAGEDGKYWKKFQGEEDCEPSVGINFSVGEDVNGKTLEEIIDLYKRRRAADKFTDWQIRYKAGVLFRFCTEFRRGDRVLTYNPRACQYHIGQIAGDKCEYRSFPERGKQGSWHYRPVNWEGNPVHLDKLSDAFLKKMKRRHTIFCIPEQQLQNEILKKSGLE